MSPAHDPHRVSGAVSCGLVAQAALRVPTEAVADLRRQPGPVCGEPLPAGFLKHADEQTVVGLAAIYQAIHDASLAPTGTAPPFDDWAVLAAPRFFGRGAMTLTMTRFRAEGAWGVSPHLIPHRSLHSPSGTYSMALKIHGPNFGIGGGPGCEVEGLLAVVGLLAEGRVPGAWIVFTSQDPELPVDPVTGQSLPGTECLALALALVPSGSPLPISARLEATPRGVEAAPAPGLADLIGRCAPPRPERAVLLAASPTVALHLRPMHPVLGEPHLGRRACGRSIVQQHSSESLS